MVRIISGQYKGRLLDTPGGQSTRPTGNKVRGALFSMVQSRVPGSRWLDLFAGSGAVGIEALSRGAESCLFVENAPRCCKIIKANLASLAISRGAEIVCRDAIVACRQLAARQRMFDIIFADPPYNMDRYYQAVLFWADRILVPDGLLIFEHRAGSRWQTPRHYTLRKEKKYGDSALSLFAKGGKL